MTTYPLTTLSATIDSTGISIPAYADILASLIASYQSIYGSDIVVTPDSQDGQFLAIVAKAFNDANLAIVDAYNAYRPGYAQGVGLASIVKINGLRKLVPTQSTAVLTIVGQAGTIITSGLVGDNQNLGTQWALPATVTIPVGGSIDVTATCTTAGATSAAIGTLTQILNPQLGWQTATNAAAATLGAPSESDVALRKRQSTSTALPALTPLDAIAAAVANVTGVTAVASYDNDTGTTNALGIPAHTIALVVSGGAVADVAGAIAAKKNPGTGTYGSTSQQVIDAKGVPNTINFYTPTQVTVNVAVTIKALTGYVSTTGTALVAALVAYINAMGIGAGDKSGAGKLYLTKASAIAAMIGSGVENTFDLLSVQLSRTGTGGLAAQDIAIAFNELAVTATADIALTVQ